MLFFAIPKLSVRYLLLMTLMQARIILLEIRNALLRFGLASVGSATVSTARKSSPPPRKKKNPEKKTPLQTIQVLFS